MQEARILHIEDDEAMRSTIELLLSVRGVHRVVAWAESLKMAYERLEAIKGGSLDANVVLLDGHLRGGAGLNHPKNIVLRMKELELDVPVVGLSLDGLRHRELVLGRDIAADLTKEGLGKEPRLLEKVFDELPEPQARQ
jgi:DNA-binding response OmpR family regulator